VQKRLDELVSKAAADYRKAQQKELEQLTAELVKELKADDALKKRITDLQEPALDEAAKSWQEKAGEYLRPFVEARGDKALAGMTPVAFSKSEEIGAIAPEATKAWIDGLKQALSDVQMASAEKSMSERRKKLLEDFKDYLDTSEEQAGRGIDMLMDKELQSILLYAGLDEERAKKLKEASATAIKETLKLWRVRAEKKLLAMDPKQREQLLKNNSTLGMDTSLPESKAQNHKVWKEAVETLVTEEERKAIASRRADVKKRRATALAVMTVADADRYLGLSEDQRLVMLEAGMEKTMKLGDSFFSAPDHGGYYGININELLECFRGDDAKKKLKACFSETQMKRWDGVTPGHLSRGSYIVRGSGDMERLISGWLFREAQDMRQRLFGVMEARIEVIQRTAKPDEKILARLRTAAKGAAEHWSVGTMRNLENYVRSQFNGATPADAAARLGNLYNPYGNDRSHSQDPVLWTATVQKELSAEQRAVYDKEVASRDAWRARGLAEMALTEAEKLVVLQPQKIPDMAKKLADVLQKYDPEISNYLSPGWHLQGYYACMGFALLEEKELEEFFGKEQMDTVKGRLLGNVSRYAETIRRQYKSRTR
jgi:hypothetical protein